VVEDIEKARLMLREGVRTVLLDLEGLAASEIAQAAPSGP
jgi:hypothetical protein